MTAPRNAYAMSTRAGAPASFDPMGRRERTLGDVPGFDRLTHKTLSDFLEKKWHPTSRMLDLSDLKSHSELAEIVPNLNNLSFCKKLAQCISDGRSWTQTLDSINFANNSIYTLKHITASLCEKGVKVINLCLTGNKISELHEIDWLGEFRLREVMLSENPVCKNGNDYHQYVVKKLRTIELMDTTSVKDWRKQLLPKLPDTKDQCMPDPEHAKIVERVCYMYFRCIDEGNFDGLIDGYDNAAFFSHAVEQSNRTYSNMGSRNYHQNLQTRNHNMQIPYNRKNPTRYMYKGRTAIVEYLRRELYGGNTIKVKHDISKFKVDAVMMGAAIFATCHGYVEYTFNGDPTTYSRCFDRTLVLKPNKAGTEWPARIANDCLTTRPSEIFPILPPENQVSSSPASANAQLQAATGLNDHFTALLLKESKGSFDAALALYKTNKAQGTIPPEAFQ